MGQEIQGFDLVPSSRFEGANSISSIATLVGVVVYGRLIGQVHLVGGGTTVMDVALVKESASSRIRGRIESASGESLACDVQFIGAIEG